MKNFIKDVLCVTIVFAIICFALYFHHPKHDLTLKQQLLKDHHHDAKTLVLGSSMGWYHIYPPIFGGHCYNLCYSSRIIDTDLKLIKCWLPYMDSLQTIIMPLTIRLSPYYVYEEDTIGRIVKNYRYFSWMHIPPPPQYKAEFILNFIPQLFNIHNHSGEIDSDSNGYMEVKAKVFDTTEDCERHYKQLHLNHFAQQMQEMASLCLDNNCRLIVVIPPIHPYLRRHLPDSVYHNITVIMDSCQRNTPFEFKNYMYDPDFVADTLYRDFIHLYKPGALLFSQKVKDDFHL